MKINPFVSTVTNRDQLGLPPIKNRELFYSVERQRKKEVNLVEKRNKAIIRKIEGLKRLERVLINEGENNNKKFEENVREIAMKTNNNINSLRKELYGIEPNSKKITENKVNSYNNTLYNNNFYKISNNLEENNNNNKVEEFEHKNEEISKKNYQNLPNINNKYELLNEDNNEEDIGDLLNFVGNLDYDKYVKDLEIREALRLIKNRVEKDENLN